MFFEPNFFCQLVECFLFKDYYLKSSHLMSISNSNMTFRIVLLEGTDGWLVSVSHTYTCLDTVSSDKSQHPSMYTFHWTIVCPLLFTGLFNSATFQVWVWVYLWASLTFLLGSFILGFESSAACWLYLRRVPEHARARGRCPKLLFAAVVDFFECTTCIALIFVVPGFSATSDVEGDFSKLIHSSCLGRNAFQLDLDWVFAYFS